MPDFCINIFLPFLCQAGWHDLQTIAAQSDLSDLKACLVADGGGGGGGGSDKRSVDAIS